MSTRYYRYFLRGGVQRRVYLPNFWMKIVKPEMPQPPNIVQFACSMEMTVHDIANYLRQIYDINVVKVNTRIALGETKRDPGRGYVVKDDDVKYAYVTLPKDEKFEFPNLFPTEEKKKQDEETEKLKGDTRKSFEKFVEQNKDRPNIPGWFSI